MRARFLCARANVLKLFRYLVARRAVEMALHKFMFAFSQRVKQQNEMWKTIPFKLFAMYIHFFLRFVWHFGKMLYPVLVGIMRQMLN